MKQLKVLVLVHASLVPPDEMGKEQETVRPPWQTEYDVVSSLRSMGHEVLPLGVDYDLKVIRDAVRIFKPHIVFNLLEEFADQVVFDQNVVSYLELLGVPYTGCNPRGLVLARDKALAKKIMRFHNISTPQFQVVPKKHKAKAPKDFAYPLMVKSLTEEASNGISQASVVHSEEKLKERVEFIHEHLGTDALVESFVEGREVFVGIIGNQRLMNLPPWQLYFHNVENPDKEFYSNKAKFDESYRTRKGISTGRATLSKSEEERVASTCKQVYKSLNLSGYARIDLRIDHEGEVQILEANPNPDIARDDELALSAEHQGIKYQDLLQKILTLGISWKPF